MRTMAWLAAAAAFCSLFSAAVNNAHALPAFEAPAYEVRPVCASGQSVSIGLAPAKMLAVRRRAGERGDAGQGDWLTFEAVPWIGALRESGASSAETSRLSSSSGWCLRDSLGRLTMEASDDADAGDAVWEVLRPQEDGSFKGNAYRGGLKLRVKGGLIRPVNILPLESYLSGVVPSEVPARFHPEALRAMACVARTYTLSHLGQHRAQGFDLCDSVHCQVYGGLKGETDNVNAVVRSTAGRVLSSCGRPIDATYHAVCGGWGAAPQDVWEGRKALPYLQARTDVTADRRITGLARTSGGACFISKSGRNGQAAQVLSGEEKLWRDFIDNPPSAYCGQATRYRWEQAYAPEELLEKLRVSLPQTLPGRPKLKGERLDVRVTRRAPGGRVAELLIATEQGSWTVGGDKVRWLTSGGRIGAEGLKSSFFYVTNRGGRIVFRGCGWGHGVGLCQEGAQGRALAGQTYERILQHYYPGTALLSL